MKNIQNKSPHQDENRDILQTTTRQIKSQIQTHPLVCSVLYYYYRSLGHC